MEYIVKYHGDLSPLGGHAEILSCRYAILDLDPAGARLLRQFPQVEYYEPSEPLSPLMRQGLSSSCVAPVQRDWGLTGQGVVLGLLDSGIDWSHPEFQAPDGRSRVLFLWDMTLSGRPPEGFYKGRELTGGELALGSESADRAGHGTAVASIAAGNSGTAPGASIVAVKLGSGSPRSTDIMRGVKYILDRAQALGMPCVINLSYGTNNGSHQGASLFETFLDDMAQQWKAVLVCAAGNEGDAGHHFHGRFTRELPVEFRIATLRENVYLSLWKNFADAVGFQLVLPDGRATPVLAAGETVQTFQFGAAAVTVLFRGPVPYSGSQEVLFRMQAAPGGLNGLWTLRCSGFRLVDGEFHAWLPTVEEVTAETSFQTPDPDLTITLPATASQPISVGGYYAAAGTLSPFSGRGDGLCRGRTLLDLTAPAENIRAARAGGGYDHFTGTSMAAPFVSGAAALMMEWGVVRGNDPFLYGQRVKGFLCRNAARSPSQDYPNPLWGYGRLDLCAAMEDLASHKEGRLP